MITSKRLVGGKAASLARLGAAGLPVPAWFVVTVAAHRRCRLSAVARREVADWSRRLGAARWAVRSSAVGEDGSQWSFAGQYQSFLDVPTKRLVSSIERCLRAASLVAVDAYRARSGASAGRASMAVLVQTMVDARAIGVGFTVDPVFGHRTLIVEAKGGGGDGVVSGEVTPERYVVARRGPVGPTKGPLSTKDVKVLRDAMLKVERTLGVPADVEWAFDATQLWVLQGRPITGIDLQT